jgi:hypothetical protein
VNENPDDIALPDLNQEGSSFRNTLLFPEENRSRNNQTSGIAVD